MVLSLWRKLRQRDYEVCPRSHRHRSGGTGSIHSKSHAFCIFPLVVLYTLGIPPPKPGDTHKTCDLRAV